MLLEEVFKLLQIKKTRTKAYRPKSNGLIERFNSTLGRMTKKFVDHNKNNWDKHLDLLLSAYRSTVHPATGYSPNILMFGREKIYQVIFFIHFLDLKNQKIFMSMFHDLHHKMEECYHMVGKILQSAAEKQKQDYDSRIVEYIKRVMLYTREKVLGRN